MQNNIEHNYVLGYTIKKIEVCTKYVQPQYKTFRKLVFNAFFNQFLEVKLPEQIFNE